MEIGFMILNVSKLMNADPNKLETGYFKQRCNLKWEMFLSSIGRYCEKKHGVVVLIVE